jgi:hypothetical protein
LARLCWAKSVLVRVGGWGERENKANSAELN